MRMKNLLQKQVYLSHNAFMASGILMLSMFFYSSALTAGTTMF